MCDTLVVREQGLTWFGKNSDREPDEPQALIFHDRVAGDAASIVRTTYLDIPQVAMRHATLLSHPLWLWGGEIGLNEHGVAIGNEAVFGKAVEKSGQALLGMDLLRLGLERGASAREALDVITTLLEQHGQGGGAGYRDKGFRYDNAFIIADPNEAWVLETAGRMWVAKRVESWAISNCYSLRNEFDLHSVGLHDEVRRQGWWNGRGEFDFAATFDTRLYAFIGGAHQRRALNTAALCSPAPAGWKSLAARLRDHGAHTDNFSGHDNRQVCLHAGSLWRPSQTTASLVARLAPGNLSYQATGTSAPCLSLFQRAEFGPDAQGGLLLPSGATVRESRWASFEPVHLRALFDADFRKVLQADRNAIEARLLANADADDGAAARAKQAGDWHAMWHAEAVRNAPKFRGRYGRWWRARIEREQADLERRFSA